MSKEWLKVEGETGLYRDPVSGGIVADDSAFVKYKAEKQKRLKEASLEMRLNRVETELADLKRDIGSILRILEKNNG